MGPLQTPGRPQEPFVFNPRRLVRFLTGSRRVVRFLTALVIFLVVCSLTFRFTHNHELASTAITPEIQAHLDKVASPLPALPQRSPWPQDGARNASIDQLYAMGHIPWLDYLDTLDDKGLAPLTKLAQRWIYERQHPPARDCPTHKFLVSEGTQEIGLGAYLHKQGFGLGAALEADLIFVMEPVGSREGAFDFADDCGSNGDPMTSQECFTQPLSSCSHRDAVVGRNAWKFGSRMWDVVNANGVKFYKDDCPSFLKEKLQAYYRGTDLTPAFFKLWWRAQSAAYLSRLNAETTDHLRTARRDAELHQTWLHGNDGRPTAGVPYPLPPGTSSLHVRHGDKASEMTLVPFEKYVDAAERYSSENPLAGRKALFVSSESPGVIENAARLPDDGRKKQLTSADEHWQVFTSNIPRFNSGPYQQIRKYGPSTMTRSWYLQLWMALECDAFFGTRASNWNRIIDEFRCIFVDKCQLPYFELGPETDWDEYFW